MKKLTNCFLILILFIGFSKVVAQAPVVTDPSNQTVTEGETAAFAITVTSGTTPYSYQWQVSFDEASFVDIANAISDNYTTPATDVSMDGFWFRCEVTNDSGVTVSNHAVLTVNAAPPVITAQPEDQNIFIGQTATFNITATGSGTLSYQWYESSNPISGATNSSYTTDPIPNETFNGTTYYCVVTNAEGSTQSENAVLYVTFPNERVTDGLQALYTFDEGSGNSVLDVSGAGSPLNLTIDNTTQVVWSPNGLYVNLNNPIHSASQATKIIGACKLTSEITLEAWIIPANLTQGAIGPTRILTLSENSTNRNFALGQEADSWDVRVRTTATSDNGIPSLNSGAGTAETVLSHVVYTMDATGNAKIYVDGSLKQTASIGGDFSNWNSNYSFGLGDEFNADKTWEGLFYLSSVYSRALTENEVTQNYQFGVDYDNKPIIVENPMNQSVLMGNTATFNVKAIGEGNLSYQWQKNGSNISGANNPSYTTPATVLADNGSNYQCIVTNSNGNATSNSASLSVAPSGARITTGQQVLYQFDQGSGTVISDVSGVGSPLNLNILTPQAVEWTNAGLKINSPANIISDVAASKIVIACQAENALTVEVWVKPNNSVQNGPARIVTNSLDRTARNFTFGQEFDDYQVGLRTSDTEISGSATNSADGGAIPELTHVVFTRSTIGVAKIFVNGVEKINNPNLTGDLSNWNPNYRLSVGNEIIDQRPYQGLIHMIAIFSRQLQRAEVAHNYSVGVTPITAPNSLIAGSNQVQQVVLNWNDNSNNEDGFIIERGEGLPIVYNVLDTVGENSSGYIDDNNLLDGKNYVYRIKAYNEITSSDLSNIDTAQTLIPTPTNLEAEAIVIGEISLSWEDNCNNEDGFDIERAVNSGGQLNYAIVGSVESNSVSYIDEAVGEGIEYAYRVSTVVGSSKSNSSNSATLYSKASFINRPIDLTISLDNISGTPVLQWKDDSFNEDGFVIERRMATVGSNFMLVDSVGQNDSTYNDILVNDSTSYIYRIYAFNENYVSDYSTEVFIDVLVGVEGEQIPTHFSLSQNFPNPFNPSTTIKFGLSSNSSVIMKLYNLLGQEIGTMVEKQYSAGNHLINFDASDLTSGIYIYTIIAESSENKNFIASKKMILLK